MRIAVIQATSQLDKNMLIFDSVKKYAPEAEIYNFGCTENEKNTYSYIEISVLIGLLLASSSVDFVVTGCSSGQGMMLACNNIPGVLCGYAPTPKDAYLFAQINNGNAISLPLGEEYTWGGEENLEQTIAGLFSEPFGQGYPRKDSERKLKDTALLKNIRKQSQIEAVELLDKLDKELIRKIMFKEDVISFILSQGTEQDILDWVRKEAEIKVLDNSATEGIKTLYVSDLDGTLLQSNERTSDYTNEVINNLTSKGMLFSYATARSLITAKKAAGGIDARIPLIVYNGAFIVDNVTGEILRANYFDKHSAEELLNTLFENEIYPIVYAYIDGKEKFSFVPELSTGGMKKFTDSRKGDIREHSVKTLDELKAGDIFYITCIGDPKQLAPMHEQYKDKYHCVYQIDIYTDEQWLEIMPKEASKANAILQLKSMLSCDRVVAFGDGKNDIDMFEIADEGYAVSNAHEELKKKATDIILSNDEDGVAKWLERILVKGK